jgi:3-hydroxyisobutyrate dehydrogenase-like beta-hydroxyacid dehydrogenase
MLEETLTIGFLGLGEAGFHISRGLINAGVPRIVAFDIHQDTPGRGEKIRERADTAGVLLVASNAELLQSSEVILSTVTADQALHAATQSALHLKPAHTYADLNSVSPNTKKSIAEVIQSAGAKFVEIAIMAPVPPYGHKVPMLAGGAAAADFAARFSSLGMRAEVVGPQIGIASATKMCRSIMAKGLEALITECMLAASYYGVDERVLASLAESFPAMDWPKLANYMVGRVVVHGHRRAREMEEVAETLRAAGVDPIMTEAIVRRMDWSVEAGLLELFQGEAPASYQDLAGRLQATNGTSRHAEHKVPPVTATPPL